MKPQIRNVMDVVRDGIANTVTVNFGPVPGTPGIGMKVKVPSRSLPGPGWQVRWRAAWMVFTGRADAVFYPGQ